MGIFECPSMHLLGPVIGLGVLFCLGRVVLDALRFVTDVLANREVVRTHLPHPAGGAEVFVDRVCNQLRALPARPAQPACATLFCGWLATPAWSSAPIIATIHEIERSPYLPYAKADLSHGPLCPHQSRGQMNVI